MKTRLYWLLVFGIMVGWAQFAHAAPLVSVSQEKNKEIIGLNLSSAAPRKVFILGNPDRLVVDVPTVAGRQTVSLPSSYHGSLIKGVRIGQFNPVTSRFVFDLAGPATVSGVRTEGKGPVKLAIELTAGKSGKSSGYTKPVVEKPMIVIDAGHGGDDPGAIGSGGIREKDVTLQYAKALKTKLLATGRYRVSLTRDNDRFIVLRQRIGLARLAKGDLFISLHADSAQERTARGLSIYTLSENASDQEAEALAARENKSDVIAGIDLSEEREDVADILISLAQRETKNRSATLATILLEALDNKIKLLQNSHRFAGFAVLKAPDIPSVLIEIGFLSHPQDAKLIKSAAYRDNVVKGIASGIEGYFSQMKNDEGE